MIERAASVGIGEGRALIGLAGRGILESRSPWLHEQEADAQGLRLTYSLFDFTDRQWQDDDLPALFDAAEQIGFAGLNITYPFKQAALPLLDELAEGAVGIGAVNTVAFTNGRRIGHNTDVNGFAAGFREGLPDVSPGRVLQIGCGGAGSATAYALLGNLGAEAVVLYDSDPDKVAALLDQLAAQFGANRVSSASDPITAAREVDGILNATPMGMAKFPGLPISASAIEQRHWVADIVYFPLETALLSEARRRGCRTLDGSGMAVHQAREAFRIFTGITADDERMHASFASFVAGRCKVAAA